MQLQQGFTCALAAALCLSLAGCSVGPDAAPPGNLRSPGSPALSANAASAAASTPTSARAAATGTDAPAAAPSVDVSAYPWLADATCGAQSVTAPLSARFAPPAGFERAPLPSGSFGAWLRGLPLRPPGAVVDYRGNTVLAADDPRFAAVVALDEGTADLQQCADSIVRLHAEWLWSRGDRTMSYRAASGTPMPFEKWLAGERPAASADGRSLSWKASARAAERDDHGAFRKYLDAVFTWANTGALARDAARTGVETLRPGDFFVLPGSPGHAVLILDVAVRGAERAVLLGQGYMPAQSFHVLRPRPGEVWFTVDAAAGALPTPFWPAPFPWSSLRRLDP